MIIVIDIILSVILTVIGYIAVCYYINNVKWNSLNPGVIKVNSASKIFYLISAFAACGLLIALFQMVYKIDLLTQLRLLTLLLVIFPIAAVDYRLQKVPNQFLITALIFRCVFYVLEFVFYGAEVLGTLWDGILGAVVISVFFLIMLLVFKNSIGMGDIKLFAVMGLYQGLWGAVNSVFFSLLVSFFLSVVLLLLRRKSRKDTISFAPSILIGTIIAISLTGM